jgi:hypothetical protein
MLINKGFTPGDTVTIKLISGEEIIARLEEDAANSVKISKPLAVTLAGKGLGMIPWVFLGEVENINLSRDHIIAMVLAKKEAADQYLESTTNIALV